jgi:hypothetical protein
MEQFPGSERLATIFEQTGDPVEVVRRMLASQAV